MTKRKGRRKLGRRRGVYGVTYGIAAYGYPLGAITGVQYPEVLGPQFPAEGGSAGEGGSGGGTPA